MKMPIPLASLPVASRKLAVRLTMCLALLPASLIGCDNSPTPESGSVEGVDITDMLDDDVKGDSPWAGRWLLTYTNQVNDVHPFLLQIDEIDGKRGLQIVDRAPRPDFKDWNLKSAGFKPDAIQLGIDAAGMPLVFEGNLYEDDEVFLGVLYMQDSPMPTPARLVKHPESSLRGFETPQLTEGVEEFQSAMKAEDSIAQFETFIAEHPNSPLVHNAYEHIVAEEIARDADPERIDTLKTKMSEAADRWSELLKRESMFTLASLLDDSPAYREIQNQTLEEISGMLGENVPDPIAVRFDLLQGRFLLTSETEEEQKQGEEQLLALLEKQPFEYNAILALAKHYEQAGQPEKALELYAKLVVAPGLGRMVNNIVDPETGEETSLVEKTRSLFEGDDKQFEEFLDHTYEEVAFYFLPEDKPNVSLSDNRGTPMLELFTGARCPPCVAGDLAVGGLEQIFPAPEAIVVRYHQHIPLPDPLTNSVGEARFSYYNGRGTPALFLNGETWGPVGGGVVQAEQYFHELTSEVATLLNKPSNIEMTLDAKAEGETISISATASKLSDTRQNQTLRLLLVEPLIHYAAPNGIRLHEMVVRDSPGGVAGKQAEGSSVSLEATVDVSKLKSQLAEQLSALEENRDYEFGTKPLDLQNLRVVAFVQDDSTKEILQSTISPVINLGGSSEGDAAAKPKEEKPAASEGSENEPKETEGNKPNMSADKADKPAAEKAEPEKADAEKMDTEKPDAEKSDAEKPSAEEKPADDKPAAEESTSSEAKASEGSKPESAEGEASAPETSEPETSEPETSETSNDGSN